MNLFSMPEPVASQRWVVAPGCVVEPAGGEFVVLCAASSVVYRMTGLAAEVVGRVRLSPGELPGYLAGAVGELAAVGVIVPAGGPMGASGPMAASAGAGAGGGGLSRRGALRLGGAAAAVGVVVLALPSAAAASSSPVGPQVNVTGATKNTYSYGGVDFDEYLFENPDSGGSFSFTANPPAEMYLSCFGGGGGGGAANGGGGGGGGVIQVDVRSDDPQFAAFTTSLLDFSIGRGGAGGTEFRDGSSGGNTVLTFRATGSGATVGVFTCRGGSGGSGADGPGGASGGVEDPDFPEVDPINSFAGGDAPSGGGGGANVGIAGGNPSGFGGDGGPGVGVRLFGGAQVLGGGGGGGGQTFGGTAGGGGGRGGNPWASAQFGVLGSGGGGGSLAVIPGEGPDPVFTNGAAGGDGFVVVSFPTGVA
jgi:hypothetical protein